MYIIRHAAREDSHDGFLLAFSLGAFHFLNGRLPSQTDSIQYCHSPEALFGAGLHLHGRVYMESMGLIYYARQPCVKIYVDTVFHFDNVRILAFTDAVISFFYLRRKSVLLFYFCLIHNLHSRPIPPFLYRASSWFLLQISDFSDFRFF